MRIISEHGCRPLLCPSGISLGYGSIAGEDKSQKGSNFAVGCAHFTKVVECDSVSVNFLMLHYSISLNRSIRISR